MQSGNHRCLLAIVVLSCISEIIGFSGPLSNPNGEHGQIRPLDTTPRGQLETPIKTWSKSLVKREESYSPWMGRKKRSEYSPWAGKRALISKEDIPKPKKFLPWVGKRSQENRSLAWDQMEQNQYNWDRMRLGGSGFNWDRLRRSDPESLEMGEYPISSLHMSRNNNVLERLRKSGAGYQWDRLRKRHGYKDDRAHRVEI
ncbi:hypothetical protein TCAL_01372 [Tigriopus californicus]|uniref:Uncharacterized protein n=1 Tax=Tigriopus californicus TaxID=6832 RepID=A0A553NUR4_TIGCA|nr:uncharacterized protein LOC131883455 [Tigriopus californicus]TRY69172.1 hypothetical protein TCAL_01372 [Tigriopus californicus]|eukprot:TCALIF_01372-PA protein Name:"Protein of unknown function" AED:0.00 eAED:0.00 QI:12/1/1/1/0.33/0.5/4/259/199